ncbi:hypothetical protein [Candidatus Hecatella orcuttiae]|jgi:hypothetical protein|uniref:hypothetical protein n=1 Tax=Candidatus Hecatella orcuttiae TaxID=1935119 RepID=UPI002867E463|nr:hypothetical protein [Candidatus Hecatella orcuttiae]
MQVQVKTPPGVELKDRRSCTRCAHLNICAVFRAVAPLLESFKGKDGQGKPPFDARRLAEVCDEYLPGYRVMEEPKIEP